MQHRSHGRSHGAETFGDDMAVGSVSQKDRMSIRMKPACGRPRELPLNDGPTRTPMTQVHKFFTSTRAISGSVAIWQPRLLLVARRNGDDVDGGQCPVTLLTP
jgi:hypothetical protein